MGRFGVLDDINMKEIWKKYVKKYEKKYVKKNKTWAGLVAGVFGENWEEIDQFVPHPTSSPPRRSINLKFNFENTIFTPVLN